MRYIIKEVLVHLIWPPVFLVLWLVFGLLLLCCLNELDLPFMKEYFGVLVMFVLVVPPVVIFLYAERKHKQASQE